MDISIWNKDHSFVQVGEEPQVNANALGLIPLLKAMFQKRKGHVTEISENGSVMPDDAGGETFFKIVEDFNGRLFYKFDSETYKQRIYLWDDGIADVTLNGNVLSIKGVSHNESFVQEIREAFVDLFLPNVQHGHIFAIVNQGGRLGLSSIGAAGIAVDKFNYTPTVLADYDYVVKDLNSQHPSGRISILEGEPGTGKTHLIRALLLEVPDAMFILVAPDMVASLAGPELLPLLMSNKQNYSLNGPIILILEDADRCLVTRQGDNIGSIQSLLNLGDGILGSLLDLRIVATTNAKKLEIEGAILRDGRLSKRLEVGPLDLESAKKCFDHLVPGKNLEDFLPVSRDRDKQKVTLAQVYGLARKAGWLPESRDKKESAASDMNDYEE